MHLSDGLANCLALTSFEWDSEPVWYQDFDRGHSVLRSLGNRSPLLTSCHLPGRSNIIFGMDETLTVA